MLKIAKAVFFITLLASGLVGPRSEARPVTPAIDTAVITAPVMVPVPQIFVKKGTETVV